MAPEVWSIVVLVAFFALGTIVRINLGALALISTFLVGTLLAGLEVEELLAFFPTDLFVIIVGTTLLLGVAQMNGTVDWIMRVCIQAVRGRVAFLPWVLFLISALMSTLGPGAVPLLAGIGAKFIVRYELRPVLIGLMVVHGAQAGAFSPVTPYGVIVNGLMERFGLQQQPWLLYALVLVFNTLVSLVGFRVFGGADILRRRDELDEESDEAAVASTSPAEGSAGMRTDAKGDLAGGGTSVHQGGSSISMRTDAGTVTSERSPIPRPTLPQIATMAALVLFIIVVTALQTDLGFTALIIAIVLLLLSSGDVRSQAINFVAWPTLLLVCGVLTYVGLLQANGTIEFVADTVARVGSPLLAVLLTCYIAAAVSSVASSLGIIGILVPLVLPFLQSGDVSVIGTVAAVAICATIVDVSPFSTYGAMVLANSHGVDVKVYERKLLGYTGVLILVAPVASWALLVLPDWLP